MHEYGFFLIPEENACDKVSYFKSIGYRVFNLPEKLVSKDDFFEGVRQTLPLDPPLCTNRSWDALDDALWSGLDSLKENRILIIWPSANLMKELEPKNFEVISCIFGGLPESLFKRKIHEGVEMKLIIFGLI